MIAADANEELIQDVAARLRRKQQGLPERNAVDKFRDLAKTFIAPDAHEAHVQKIMKMVEKAQRTGAVTPDFTSASLLANPDVEIARKVLDRISAKNPLPVPGLAPR
jgi:hypothetical protein